MAFSGSAARGKPPRKSTPMPTAALQVFAAQCAPPYNAMGGERIQKSPGVQARRSQAHHTTTASSCLLLLKGFRPRVFMHILHHRIVLWENMSIGGTLVPRRAAVEDSRQGNTSRMVVNDRHQRQRSREAVKKIRRGKP